MYEILIQAEQGSDFVALGIAIKEEFTRRGTDMDGWKGLGEEN